MYMRGSVVAFDLDNTLGDFALVSSLWPERTVPKKKFSSFCRMMNKNMQVYSPLLSIIPSLVNARERGELSAIVMYTNNNGHPSWASAIAGHIGLLNGTRVFDAVVPAFRPELGENQCRRSSQKSYADLCRCLALPEGTKICFVDDQEHTWMRCPHVEYVKVSPYYCNDRRSTRRFTRRRATRVGKTRRAAYR